MNGVAVTLPIEDWNKVLSILSQAPWNIANPIIMAMGEQLRARQANEAETRADTEARNPGTRPRPNGADLNP